MKIELRKRRLKNGSDSLFLDIYHEGKRSYEFLKLYTKRGNPENKEILELAEKIKAKRLIDLSNQEYEQVSTQKKKTSFVKYFEKHIKEKDKWSNHYGAQKHLNLFLNNKDIRFKEIDKKWLNSFSEYLSKKAKPRNKSKSTLKPNTAFLYFRIVKSVLYEASENGFIRAETIRAAKKLPKAKTKRGFLELSEIEKLANTDLRESEIKRAFLFSCYTGLRQSDIRNLKWGDISEGNILKIKMQKVKEPLRLKLNKTALSLIKANKIHHLPEIKIFNLPKDRTTINRHLTSWFNVAKVNKKAFYHLSRHTFATLGLSSDIDIYTVSKLLGHSNIKTTEIYSNLIDKKKDEAMDNLPEIKVNL